MIQLPPITDIQQQVRAALEEDVGSGDITAELIPAANLAKATVFARESGVLCGAAWVEEIFRQLQAPVELQWQLADGDEFQYDQPLLKLAGPARTIMTGERCALNFLQTLSATASRTRELCKLVAHTSVQLLDTRKTLPGLRSAQKYAVRTGGGVNHRQGLFDAYLIKENHIAACGGINAAVTAARHQNPELPVEVEVTNREELQQALASGTDIIMLDNFSLPDLAEAVTVNAGQAKLEASGGVDADSLVNIAETGVDYISIGALTKHCRAIDLSLLIE